MDNYTIGALAALLISSLLSGGIIAIVYEANFFECALLALMTIVIALLITGSVFYGVDKFERRKNAGEQH